MKYINGGVHSKFQAIAFIIFGKKRVDLFKCMLLIITSKTTHHKCLIHLDFDFWSLLIHWVLVYVN
jgi:hypothetical protein